MPQLRTAAIYHFLSLQFRRCEYHANVMKTFEHTSRNVVRITRNHLMIRLPPFCLTARRPSVVQSICRMIAVVHVFNGQDTESTAIEPAPSMHGCNRRLEKFLRDERRHERAQNHYADQDRVLALVDDFILQSK